MVRQEPSPGLLDAEALYLQTSHVRGRKRRCHSGVQREPVEVTVKEVTSGQPALKHANVFDSNGEYYEVHGTSVVMTNS